MSQSFRHRPGSAIRRLVFAALVAGLCAGAAWLGYTAWRLERAPLPVASTGAIFTVKSGESVDALARRLARRGIIEHAWDLVVLARLQGEGRHVQAGEYRVTARMSMSGLLNRLVSGAVVMHSFTIVPGSTFRQVRAALARDDVFRNDLESLDTAGIMRRIGHPGTSPEGRFLPDTYAFQRGTPDSKILERAYKAMQQYMHSQWAQRASGLPYQAPYQALILASVIEKETAVPAERVKIAGVFVRRLQRNMHLDADPTVIYGLGKTYNGDLTRADLHKDTPYNTYVHRGLPPTPICIPGKASIDAALHPAPGSALYFVAKGDGTHVFSDTLSGQEKMIRKYQLDRKEAGKGNGGKRPVHHP